MAILEVELHYLRVDLLLSLHHLQYIFFTDISAPSIHLTNISIPSMMQMLPSIFKDVSITLMAKLSINHLSLSSTVDPAMNEAGVCVVESK